MLGHYGDLMQNGQVSIWVPIVVGVIGLIGVIGGQLVNAWREDRRWRRDQDREEIRWKRDLERESMRLSHESAESWRDTRIAVYSKLLDHLNSVVEASRELTNVGDDMALALELRTQAVALLDDLQDFTKRSLLLADSPLLSLLRKSMGEPLFAVPHPTVVDSARGPDTSRRHAFINAYRSSYDKSLSFYNAVLDECRREVGVSPLARGATKENE